MQDAPQEGYGGGSSALPLKMTGAWISCSVLPTDDNSSQMPPSCCPLNSAGAGGPRVRGERALQPRWARAGGPAGPGDRGARARVSLHPSPPSSPAQPGRWPRPHPRAGRRAGRARRPRRSGIAREENGVGRTYLGEFGAHQDEEEEAEELPGRLHVSLPPRPCWHAEPGCSPAGGCVDADALPRPWLGGGAGCVPASSAPGAGGARAVLRGASALHVARVPVPEVPAGLGGGRGAALGPSSWRRPADARRRCQKFSGRRGGGWRRGARATARARDGGRGGGRRGGRPGQDVTSERRGGGVRLRGSPRSAPDGPAARLQAPATRGGHAGTAGAGAPAPGRNDGSQSGEGAGLGAKAWHLQEERG